MKINKLKKLKNGKYKIFLEDGSVCTTYDDVILEKELLLSKEMDDYLLDEIAATTHYHEVYHKMVRKIAQKYRSEKEIVDLLKQENISDLGQEKVIKKLKQNDLLNDERFMYAYIHDKVHLTLDGPQLIFKNLKEHGIREDTIINALDKIEENIFMNKIYQYIDKKIKANHKYSKMLFSQKIMDALIQKGYDKTMITKVLDKFTIIDADIIQKEYEKISCKIAQRYSEKERIIKIKQKLYSKGFAPDEIDAVIRLNLK